jgi:endonuclease YncB( thermonuclease family)
MQGNRCGVAVGALLLCLVAQAAPPKSVQGLVSKVVDGDSLWLTLPDKPPIEVRLRDIDAPESCQPWGPEARKALADLALNKVATLQVSGRDQYGRTLGTLLIEDLNVSRFMVENGHAWSVRTRWDQGPLVKQEKMARALTRGLHALPGAVQPKEFRQRQGPCVVAETPAARPAPAGAPR